jgi:hypothetical protein
MRDSVTKAVGQGSCLGASVNNFLVTLLSMRLQMVRQRRRFKHASSIQLIAKHVLGCWFVSILPTETRTSPSIRSELRLALG